MTILAGPTQCCCCCRIYGTCWAVFLWNLENVIFAIFWQIWHSPGFSVTSAFSVTVVKCIDFEQFANMTFSRYQRNTENMANVHFSRSQCNIANMTFSRCFCGNEGPGIWGLMMIKYSPHRSVPIFTRVQRECNAIKVSLMNFCECCGWLHVLSGRNESKNWMRRTILKSRHYK